MNTTQLIHKAGSAADGPTNSVIFLNGMFGGDPNGGTGDSVPGVTQGVGDTNASGLPVADVRLLLLDRAFMNKPRRTAKLLVQTIIKDSSSAGENFIYFTCTFLLYRRNTLCDV